MHVNLNIYTKFHLQVTQLPTAFCNALISDSFSFYQVSSDEIFLTLLNFKKLFLKKRLVFCLILTPLLTIASCRSLTMSFPSTPSHLNPLVQLVRMALSSPTCRQGNEKVKPSGNSLSIKSWSFINLKMQSAIWSKSWKKEENGFCYNLLGFFILHKNFHAYTYSNVIYVHVLIRDINFRHN